MKQLRFFLLTALIWLIPLQMVAVGGDASAVNVSATILSKNKCKFNTKNPVLDFGTLDPSNAVVRNESVAISFVCNGAVDPATYVMSDNGGLDNYKMTHASDLTQKIPYTLTINSASGTVPKGVDQNLTIDVSIQNTDYQTALVGNYSDTIILTLLP